MRMMFRNSRARSQYLTKVFSSAWTGLALTSVAAFFCGKTAFCSDFHSARSEALGGAGHAAPSLNDAIYLNPSYTSLIKTYSVSFNFLTFDGGDVLPDGSNAIHGRNVNISLLDGRSELFQAGVGYTRRDGHNQLTVGASKAILQEFGVGLGGKFIFPTDPDQKVVRDSTLSITFMATDWLQVAGLVDNLLETDDGKARNLYREYILGTKISLQNIVNVYFDPHWVPSLQDQSYGHEFGMELTFFSDFFFRMGAYKNSMMPHREGLRGRGYGLGVGWVAPRLSLDYAVSHSVEPDAESVHIFGATVFF